MICKHGLYVDHVKVSNILKYPNLITLKYLIHHLMNLRVTPYEFI